MRVIPTYLYPPSSPYGPVGEQQDLQGDRESRIEGLQAYYAEHDADGKRYARRKEPPTRVRRLDTGEVGTVAEISRSLGVTKNRVYRALNIGGWVSGTKTEVERYGV